MARPQVACSADVVVAYDASARLISLGAAATNTPILEWKWTVLAVPPGSTAHIGVKGNFTDGIAAVQNPQLLIDAAIDGGYTLQCEARNADGWSLPLVDRADSQQLIIVRTQNQQLWIPGDYAYDWGSTYLNPTLRALEAASGGVDEFIELTDCPSAYTGHDDKFVTVNEETPGLQFTKLVDRVSGEDGVDVVEGLDGGVVVSAPGGVRQIQITVGSTAGTYNSTTSIPSGSKVLEVVTQITTAYDGGASIAVTVNGSSPLNIQTTSENAPGVINDYSSEPLLNVASANAGVVRATVAGTPTVGAATVLVTYRETALP